jgi:hypothetical protein
MFKITSYQLKPSLTKTTFMKPFALTISLLMLFCCVKAQTPTCIVLKDSLIGSYEGGCEKGKASGIGKASGVDTYDGNFKNGLPEGKGKYTWKNGDYYDGAWKAGLKEGKGEMHLNARKKDSVVTGFWKKDVYKGENEKPYVIYNVTSDIGRVSVAKISGKKHDIVISVENLMDGNGTSMRTNSLQAATVMTDFQITRGIYLSKASTTLTNKDVTTFKDVTFPFRGVFYFGTSSVEIEFFEESNWDVTVPINK